MLLMNQYLFGCIEHLMPMNCNIIFLKGINHFRTNNRIERIVNDISYIQEWKYQRQRIWRQISNIYRPILELLTIFRRDGVIKTIYQQNKENLRFGQSSKQKWGIKQMEIFHQSFSCTPYTVKYFYFYSIHFTSAIFM